MLAIALAACGRASSNNSGPSVATVYSGRVVLNDLNPVVRDLPSWWDGPPTFDVKPLNSATRPDFERFAVVVRFAHDHGKPLEVRAGRAVERSEEHTSELQSQSNLVCRLLLEKKKS